MAAARLAAAKTVPLALIHQADALHQHLKAALDELGANVVYDTHVSAFSYGALDGSGAEVVVINLDPDADDFDALGELLGDETRRVIINDGEVTSKLSGWDLARWTRHLAAKLLGVDEVLPQRPEGAQAIPVRVKAAVASSGEADKFQIAGSELAAALGADTASRIEATRAELVTSEEPVSVAIYQRPTEVPAYDVDAAELTQHIGDLPSAPSFSLEIDVSQIDAAIGVDSGDEVRDDSIEPTVTTSRHDAPTLEIPSPATPVAAQDATHDVDASETSFDEFDTAAAAFAQRATPAPAGDDFSFTLSDEEVSLLGGDVEDTFVRLPTATEEVVDNDFSSSVEALGFVEATDDFPREDVPDLDAILRSAGPKDDNPPPSVRAKPAADAPPAAAKPESTSPKSDAPKERTLADFESALAGLSLVEDDENAPYVAPVAEAPKPAQSAPTRDFSSALSSLSLEPIDEGDDGDAPKPAAPSGRASFGLGTDSASMGAPAPAAAAAPKTISPAPKAAALAMDVSDDLSIDGLDFNFSEETEIRADSIVRLGANDPGIDDLAVDLDSELDALLQREAELASTPASRVERVWVLGASIGGPDAVREFLAALPANVPATFLLAQHMGADFLELMVQQLAKASPLKVRVATHGDLAAHGEVVVVPLSEAIDVEQNGYIRISPATDASPYTPSIDRVMRAVADRYGRNAGAIIFSGMAHDAIEGAGYIRQKGGTIWVQSPASCVISSMVDGALDAGVVAFQGTPAELAKHFIDEVAR